MPMAALEVHCKTLQGEVIKVQLAEGDRVAGDLVRALASPPHNAVASRVFWRGRPLSKTTALPEAVGRDGEFVTIVLSSSDRKRQKAVQRGSGDGAVDCTGQQQQTHRADEISGDGVSTLIPGYVCRPPHSSPLKASQSVAVGGSGANIRPQPLSYDTVDPKSTGGAAGGGNTESEPPPSSSDAALMPPVAIRLLSQFRCLDGICRFLGRQRIQSTWGTVKKALVELAARESPERKGCCDSTEADCLQDIRDMALVCPEIIGISDEIRFADDSVDFIINFHTGSPLSERLLLRGEERVEDGKDGSAARGEEPIPPAVVLPKKRKKTAYSSAHRLKIMEAALMRAIVRVQSCDLNKRMPDMREFLHEGFEWDKAFAPQEVTIERIRAAALVSLEAEGAAMICTRPVRAPQQTKEHEVCGSTEALKPGDFVAHLRQLKSYKGQIVHVEPICAREVEYGKPTDPLSDRLQKALAQGGITRLFCHQVRALEALRKSKNVVISTSTSSGKSLCYIMPLLETLEQDRGACAIFLFPTKALAQDQYQSLRSVLERSGFDPGIVQVYDGDTPDHQRSAIRAQAQLLITNPDMLHVSVLPVHSSFHRLMSNLRFVVIDEGHSYRGIFGSHVAMVIRRLRRICESHAAQEEYERAHRHAPYPGAGPQFVVCSATVANPLEHASTLTGVDQGAFVLVDNDGSPRGEKQFLLWNPPLAEEEEQKEKKSRKKNKKDNDSSPSQPSARALSEHARSSRQRSNQSKRGKAGALLGQVSLDEWRSNFSTDLEASGGPERPADMERGMIIRRGFDPFGDTTFADHRIASSTDGAAQRLPGREWRERYGAAGVSKSERRRSPMCEIAALLAECVQHGLQTIAFCKTRKLCELVLAYTREILRDVSQRACKPEIASLASRLAVYRSGYGAEERRSVEAALSSGSLIGVAATNALELGIDVGQLDVTLTLGFPGSVASLWQQAGRAGRRRQESCSIFVAFDGPLDQYFMRHPQKLFGRPIESVHIDLSNFQLLRQHIACAAGELAVDAEKDSVFFGRHLREVIRTLKCAGVLGIHPTSAAAGASRLYYVGKRSPARDVSLRAIDPERYKIECDGQVIEEIEACKAFYQVYVGAVYMYQGRAHLVSKLDLTTQVATVHPAAVKYYTQIRDYTDVHVVGGSQLAYSPQDAAGQETPIRCRPTKAQSTNAVITTRWLGFHRIWHGSGKVFDTVDLFLPDVSFTTQAVFLRLPPSIRTRLVELQLPFREGVHAACHAIQNAVPSFVMCNACDLRTECDNPYNSRFKPERLLLFDAHPGGIGLSSRIRPYFSEILARALEMVESCDCTAVTGCPGCVQHTHCSEYNSVIHKVAGAAVLKLALEHESQQHQQQQEGSGYLI